MAIATAIAAITNATAITKSMRFTIFHLLSSFPESEQFHLVLKRGIAS